MANKPNKNSNFGFGELIEGDELFAWIHSEEGQECQAAIDDVTDALAKACVDVNARKIIWSDGVALTIDETVKRICKSSDCQAVDILEQVIAWLEMDYLPKDLSESEMEKFETKIGKWVDKYHQMI